MQSDSHTHPHTHTHTFAQKIHTKIHTKLSIYERDYNVILKIAQHKHPFLSFNRSSIHALMYPLIGLRAFLCDRKRLIPRPERGR